MNSGRRRLRVWAGELRGLRSRKIGEKIVEERREARSVRRRRESSGGGGRGRGREDVRKERRSGVGRRRGEDKEEGEGEEGEHEAVSEGDGPSGPEERREALEVGDHSPPTHRQIFCRVAHGGVEGSGGLSSKLSHSLAKVSSVTNGAPELHSRGRS